MKDIIISNPQKVLDEAIANACGLKRYKKIISDLYRYDVSQDKDYKKNFVAYYKVRRDKDWLDKYFKYLQDNKQNKSLTFEEVFDFLSSIEHNTKYGKKCTEEVSFSSKLLATINPEYPIWDSRVIKFLEISVPKNSLDKKKAIIEAYQRLKESIEKFINTDEGKKCIEEFDARFSDYKDISKVKKIDTYLWNLGKE